jgi:hypothetical protein
MLTVQLFATVLRFVTARHDRLHAFFDGFVEEGVLNSSIPCVCTAATMTVPLADSICGFMPVKYRFDNELEWLPLLKFEPTYQPVNF